MLLEDEGYEVMTAFDGKEGLEKAKTFAPDLITLDLTMPRHSGIRMFHELKSEKHTADIPVMIITGVPSDLTDIISNPNNPQPQAFLEKPIDRQLFLEKIEMVLADNF